MSVWNQDRYIKAWNYASVAHNGQQIPGKEIAYINHIGLVAMEAMAAVAHEPIERPDLLVDCALLHDTIEDTTTSFADIAAAFGLADGGGSAATTSTTSASSRIFLPDTV